MKNEKKRGLGAALPMGGMTLFEPGPSGTQLIAQPNMRDYAVGQDIELSLGYSSQVFTQCAFNDKKRLDQNKRKWTTMRTEISNANNHPVKVRVQLGFPTTVDVRWPRKTIKLKDGNQIVEVTVPANTRRKFNWKIRHTEAYLAGL